MVNWKDPLVELASAHMVLWVAYLSAGIYVWEFLVTADFDWYCVTRRRTLRWTLVPYLATRYACLVALASASYAGNVFHPIPNCTDWWCVVYVGLRWYVNSALSIEEQAGACVSMSSVTLLLMIRVIAIAKQNRLIASFLGCLWLAETATLMYSVAKIEGFYVLPLLACGGAHTSVSRMNVLVSFFNHLACLALVIGLLLRWRGEGLWRVLLSQGIIYFAVTLIAYTPLSVMLLLNLNDGMNLIFQLPTLVALVIFGGRMYRGLVRFAGQTEEDAFTMTSSDLSWARPKTQSRAIVSAFLPTSPVGGESRLSSEDARPARPPTQHVEA